MADSLVTLVYSGAVGDGCSVTSAHAAATLSARCTDASLPHAQEAQETGMQRNLFVDRKTCNGMAQPQLFMRRQATHGDLRLIARFATSAQPS